MTLNTNNKTFNEAKAAAQEVFLPYEAADKRPVLSGMGIVTPIADDVDTLCDLAMSGQNAFREIDRFATDWCESDLACAFGLGDDAKSSPDGFRRKWMDRAVWYLLDALDRALASAKLDLNSYDPERVAIILGTSHSGLVTTEDLFEASRSGTLTDTDPRRVLAIPASHICSAVAAATGAKGVRRTISSACASSTGAMGSAADLIRSGKADVVITGGTDTVSLAVLAGFNSLRALAADGCSPFGTNPGITLGEGAGVFILERLDHAAKRGADVQAEIMGYALSGDAHHATAPDDQGDGIARVLTAALADADVAPNEVDYLSAHGTGTDANDIAESRATAAIFGDSVPLSTPKSIIGHTLGASGVIETALTLGLAERDMIAPTLGFDGLREGCEALDYVPNAARAKTVDTFVCNNYGFGGNNASVVMKRNVARKVRGTSAQPKQNRVFISGTSTVNASGETGSDSLVSMMFAAAKGDAEPTTYKVKDDRLPASFKRQIGRTSPMVKFAVSATGEALARAGLNKELHADTGLIYSVVTGAQKSTEKYMESIATDGPGFASAQQFPNTTNNAPAGQVSIAYGLKGYNTTLCGSAGSMGYAIELIANGRQDRVVGAAADEHTDLLEQFYDHAGLLADTSVAPFAGQRGINFGEGAAAILFESETSLGARSVAPMAEIIGWAESHDGTYLGINRKGEALSRAIEAALSQADVTQDQIDLVIAGGTGPGYFGKAELKALARFEEAQVKRISPVVGNGYGPAHTPLAILGAGASIVAVACLPDNTKPEIVLCAGLDLTGVAFAAVVRRIAEDVA